LKAIEQIVTGRRVVRLARRQTKPYGQALSVDERMDLGPETASRAAETMISTAPLLHEES